MFCLAVQNVKLIHTSLSNLYMLWANKTLFLNGWLAGWLADCYYTELNAVQLSRWVLVCPVGERRGALAIPYCAQTPLQVRLIGPVPCPVSTYYGLHCHGTWTESGAEEGNILVLCCAVLCCAVLCCAVLCCASAVLCECCVKSSNPNLFPIKKVTLNAFPSLTLTMKGYHMFCVVFQAFLYVEKEMERNTFFEIRQVYI